MPSNSKIAPYLGRFLGLIQHWCPLYLMFGRSRLSADGGEVLVDRYALGCLGVAAIVYSLSYFPFSVHWLNFFLALVVMGLSLWRILEVLAFHFGVLVARAGKGREISLTSLERTFVLVLANYLEVTFWFATWYSFMVHWGRFTSYPSTLFLPIFRESLAMMLVNSSGLFVPGPSWLLWLIICFQSLVGLFLTLVVVSRAISVLPPPKEG